MPKRLLPILMSALFVLGTIWVVNRFFPRIRAAVFGAPAA